MSAETKKANANTARPEPPQTAYLDQLETYTPERIAEFLLNNAVSPEDYAAALVEVRNMGIDPATIPHEPPPGV